MSSTWTALRGTRAAQGKIRVLVVDDSVVIRHLVMHALREEAGHRGGGRRAERRRRLARIPEVQPDVVTLDIEMPVMDGLTALRQIRKLHPRLRTIMFSTLTTRGASSTFEALALGADDYVAKASNAGSLDQSMASLRGELVPKIRQFFAPATAPAPALAPKPAPAVPSAKPYRATAVRRVAPFQILGIGVSTGRSAGARPA